VPEKIIKSRLKKTGYYNVGIQIDGVRKFFSTHQLVAMAFLNHVPNGKKDVINHKNEIKSDNRVSNLEIVSVRYNTVYSIDKTKTTSKYTGVFWHKRDKVWRSAIWIDGKRKNLGSFDNEYEAHLTYQSVLSEI
jgi:hypothetical protein